MQALYIFLAIVVGLLFPAGHSLTFLIRYNLMVMLFFCFLGISFQWNLVRRHHFVILLVNVSLPLLLFAMLLPVDRIIAFAVFTIGIAPTAAVAPVIADFLKSKVDFVTTSVLITSPAIAVVLPILLPLIAEVHHPVQVGDILIPVSIVIFGPLLASQLLKWTIASQVPAILRLKRISFYLFLLNVFIASAKAAHFVQNDQQTTWRGIVMIGVAIGCLCVGQFLLGGWLGRKHLPIACSLSLGRKNTMFAIWVALTFLDPVIALGPMFYIFFQNAFNGWQMWQLEKNAVKRVL